MMQYSKKYTVKRLTIKGKAFGKIYIPVLNVNETFGSSSSAGKSIPVAVFEGFMALSVVWPCFSTRDALSATYGFIKGSKIFFLFNHTNAR